MSRSSGQATIELIVVFFGFAALFLGLFELTRLYQAKHALATATFAAARAGALHHAQVEVMNAELANQMSVLLMEGGRSARRLERAKVQAAAIARLPGSGIEIISPYRDAISHFARPQWIVLEGESTAQWRELLPIDNLKWRPHDVRGSEPVESTPPLNTQDANVLRIRSLWCHRLVTPIAQVIVFAVAQLTPSSAARQSSCSPLSSIRPGSAEEFPYVALASDATVRMQSSFIPSQPRN